MGYLRSISVFALGLAASGCAIVFDDPDDAKDPPNVPPSPPPTPEPDNETPQLLPQLCTSGVPGAPDCPVNIVDLGDLKATGSFGFVVQAVGSGFYFNGLQFTAGANGLYIEDPTLRLWASPDGRPTELAFDTTLNLPPGTSMALGGGTASFVQSPLAAVSMRFAAIGPFRP